MNKDLKNFMAIVTMHFVLFSAVPLTNYGIWYYKNIFKKKMRVKKYVKKHCKKFGIRYKDFLKMTQDDLKKVYRSKAKKIHPDVGGNTEDFKVFKNSYDSLYSLF